MTNGKRRIELGQYIVTDPEICHGKPTFKGTRIMVWQVLDDVADAKPIAPAQQCQRHSAESVLRRF